MLLEVTPETYGIMQVKMSKDVAEALLESLDSATERTHMVEVLAHCLASFVNAEIQVEELR